MAKSIKILLYIRRILLIYQKSKKYKNITSMSEGQKV